MKDETVYLRHILIAIEEIKKFTAANARDDKTLRAVERDIEIIGEAARNLGREFHVNNPSVPWADISECGIRSHMITSGLMLMQYGFWSKRICQYLKTRFVQF